MLMFDEMPYNANVRSAHGWDGENETWNIIINGYYIDIDKRTFDEVNRAMSMKNGRDIGVLTTHL